MMRDEFLNLKKDTEVKKEIFNEEFHYKYGFVYSIDIEKGTIAVALKDNKSENWHYLTTDFSKSKDLQNEK